MVSRRKPKQKSKYLGRRHFGAGDVKNKRGSGNRGGRGNAGRCKHKGTWVAVYAPGYFGKYGFANPNTKDIPVSHLFEINQRAITNRLQKREGRYYFEFEGKILGDGAISVPILIKAFAWSKKTEEKVKQAGGQMEKLGGSKTPEAA
jgi:large subunit ribosomal protein L15